VDNIQYIAVSKLTELVEIYLDEAIALFDEKAQLTKTDSGKWLELVYCILAGTQFPVSKLKPLFKNLIHPGNRHLVEFPHISDPDKTEKLAIFLRQQGYRYYNQKALTITSAARFFLERYRGDISAFSRESISPDDLRNILVKNISGIGFKIASHWLRNIGFDICTIDLHLRRLFYNLSITDDDADKDLDRDLFIRLQQIFQEVGRLKNVRTGVVQYSIWRYTVERCANWKCHKCALRTFCLRGASAPPLVEQLEMSWEIQDSGDG